MHCSALQRRSTLRAYLNPIELATRPFETLGLDFMGPILPHSPLGNNHILVITDYFTKWVEVIPLRTTSALVTAKALMDRVILYHGPPKTVVTDRGPNFTSELFSSLCKS
jgi:transposase InsO family protein